MEECPLVSILMTAYNREKYIAEAIESVLASSYQKWELIVVDDQSKDKTLEIARSYELRDPRIKVILNDKNLGDYPNRNKAASFARGKYIKYLDSDDVFYPYGLEVMVAAMEKYPEAGIGLAFFNHPTTEPLPLMLSSECSLKDHFTKRGVLYVGPSGAIYRRDFFNQLCGFDYYGVASDYAFNLKAVAQKPLVSLPFDLFWYRVHANQEYHLLNKHYDQLNFQIHKDFCRSLSNKKLAKWIASVLSLFFIKKCLRTVLKLKLFQSITYLFRFFEMFRLMLSLK